MAPFRAASGFRLVLGRDQALRITGAVWLSVNY